MPANKYQYRIKVKRMIQSQERTAIMIVKSDDSVVISKPDDKGTVIYLEEKTSTISKLIPWIKDNNITLFQIEREEEVGV